MELGVSNRGHAAGRGTEQMGAAESDTIMTNITVEEIKYIPPRND